MDRQARFYHERQRKAYPRYGMLERKHDGNGFICLNCRGFVSSDSEISGVRNRNHCPYCLWSRHLDLSQPGDRLSACKSSMRPIGLTTKVVFKKFGQSRGELMLIHLCEGCGQLSINRVAADDTAETLLVVLEASYGMDRSMQSSMEACGIHPLEAADRYAVRFQLFGHVMDSAGRI